MMRWIIETSVALTIGKIQDGRKSRVDDERILSARQRHVVAHGPESRPDVGRDEDRPAAPALHLDIGCGVLVRGGGRGRAHDPHLAIDARRGNRGLG